MYPRYTKLAGVSHAGFSTLARHHQKGPNMKAIYSKNISHLLRQNMQSADALGQQAVAMCFCVVTRNLWKTSQIERQNAVFNVLKDPGWETPANFVYLGHTNLVGNSRQTTKYYRNSHKIRVSHNTNFFDKQLCLGIRSH